MEKVAKVQASFPIANPNNPPIFGDAQNLKEIILGDQGHYKIIRGSESISGIMLCERLGEGPLLVTKMIRGRAVEFEVNGFC
jgi:hypothetical protein